MLQTMFARISARMIAFAAVVAATGLITTAAEAGGGVRLGFGYPLGSFVATPGGGGNAGSYAAKKQARSKASANRLAQERAAPRAKSAARKAAPETQAIVTAQAPEARSTTTPEPAPTTDSADATHANSGTQTSAALTKEQSTSAANPAEIGCKKFIPEVGTTVTVACETNE